MFKFSRFGAWAMLMAAIALEILGLSLLEVFKERPVFSKVILVLLMNVSYFLMSLTLRQISVGVAYATWEIVGGIGILLVSFVFFAPNLSTSQYLGIIVGFTGIICIILGEEHSDKKEVAKPLHLANSDKNGVLQENSQNPSQNSSNFNTKENSSVFTAKSVNFAKNSAQNSQNFATQNNAVRKNSKNSAKKGD